MKEIEDLLGRDNVKYNEPMSKHTSFKIGGEADIFAMVDNEEKLQELLKIAKRQNLKVTVIGNGTNLLVSDEGIRGLTIKYKANEININETNINIKNANSNKSMNIQKAESSESEINHKNQIENVKIIAQAGALNSIIAQKALENNLSGIEFLAGIPGTIAGAVYMNAGAFGSEIKDILYYVKYIDIDTNEIKEITINNEGMEDYINYQANDLQEEQNKYFSYRSSIFQKMNTVILEIGLNLKKAEKEEITNKMNEYKKKRMDTQPLDKPSAGSTFKRGEDFISAKLIDEAGLKGYRIGGAEVSTKHAGFIINAGGATAKDVLELIDYVKKTVKEKFGKEIEEEVKIIKRKIKDTM